MPMMAMAAPVRSKGANIMRKCEDPPAPAAAMPSIQRARLARLAEEPVYL